MADNKNIVSEATTVLFKVATDEVSYSGDTAQIQLNRLVHVTGAEGSKSVVELIRLEDAAHTSGDPGMPIFAVRSDTAASTSTTDGDYSCLITDSTGKLHVNVGAMTPGTAAGNLGKAEDAAHSSGDVGIMALAVRSAAAADRSAGNTDGDYEPLGLDASGRLHTRPAIGATATLTTQADQASSATLLSANSARLAAIIINDSTEILYVKYGITATTTDWTYRLQAGEDMREELYSGRIDGIWANNASGSARITELT